MTSVFVSHSSRDRADAVQVRRILKEVGCRVWLDATDMRAAGDLEGQLAKAIADADVFCLLLSPTSAASTWVGKEIEVAKRERERRDQLLLPIILRPCELPPAIGKISGLRAYQAYDGVENDYIRLQLVQAVTGAATVGEVELDAAFQKHLADVARQKEAARVLPALAKGLDRIRKLPIRSVEVGLDPRIFTQPAYVDDPFVLELRLQLDPLFDTPMSFFFAPFQEGSTWPEEFDFLPRSIDDFRDDQPRIDGRFAWSGYEATLTPNVDGTDLGAVDAALTLTLDGSEHSPRSSGGSLFHASMPGLRTRLELPSLEKLVADACTFAVITHHWRSRTARPVEADQTDIAVRVVARFPDADNLSCTLFRSAHDARERTLLEGDFLGAIASPIEREAVLGQYRPTAAWEAEERDKRRRAVHRMLLLDPEEIEWGDDRRLLARLLRHRAQLAALRNRLLPIFAWDAIPGKDSARLRAYLKEAFAHQDKWVHLVFASEEEIDAAGIAGTPDRRAVELRWGDGRQLTLRRSEDDSRARVTYRDGSGGERELDPFYVAAPHGALTVFLADRLDVLNACAKILALLHPLIVERPAPRYEDVFLFQEASSHLVEHYISVEAFQQAAEGAERLLGTMQRLGQGDSLEPQHVRWTAAALQLLARCCAGRGDRKAAAQHLGAAVDLRCMLHRRLDNEDSRLELVKALEDALALANRCKLGPFATTVAWRNDLKRLEAAEAALAKMETQLEIPASDLRGVAGLLAQIRTSHGQGEINGRPGRYINAEPKGRLDDAAWKRLDRILARHGFEWERTLEGGEGAARWRALWCRWLPVRKAPKPAKAPKTGGRRRRPGRAARRKGAA
jgi:TIR domain